MGQNSEIKEWEIETSSEFAEPEDSLSLKKASAESVTAEGDLYAKINCGPERM